MRARRRSRRHRRDSWPDCLRDLAPAKAAHGRKPFERLTATGRSAKFRVKNSAAGRDRRASRVSGRIIRIGPGFRTSLEREGIRPGSTAFRAVARTISTLSDATTLPGAGDLRGLEPTESAVRTWADARLVPRELRDAELGEPGASLVAGNSPWRARRFTASILLRLYERGVPCPSVRLSGREEASGYRAAHCAAGLASRSSGS